MEMMIRKLEEASMEGNVTTLLELLEKDSLILDRQIVGCFNETPLHVSSMLGHLDFSNEILSRKPEMAVKTSIPTKSTPLHLAAAKGCLEIVKSLLKVHPDITCFAIDRDGYNPCHVAAMKGHMSVLKELVRVRPSAVRAFVQKDGLKESILHLCVKYNQFEVLKFLVEVIIGDDHDFVNFLDGDGSTILHLAVADKHIEVIKFIISNTKVEVNAKNANGYTALDIFAQSRKDVNDMLISESLQLVGALKAQHLSGPLNHQAGQLVRIRVDHGDTHKDNRQVVFVAKTDNWLEKKYNVLILVASLIATMAFAARLSNVGGFWQDDFEGNTESSPRHAGTSITSDKDSLYYEIYVICDTISCVSALSAILLLICGIPLKRRFYVRTIMVIMWTAITALAMAYLLALQISTQTEVGSNKFLVWFTILCVWCGILGLLALVHTIRLIVKAIKILVRFIRRRGTVSSSITMMNDNHV